MEIFRDYVQHCGLAAPSISVSHTSTKLKSSSQFACTLTPQIPKKYLLEYKKLSAKVRTEINALPDKDRKHLQSINKVREDVAQGFATG
jgi:hypothetical protein